jgi:YD repeat-containing protein
LTQGYDNQYRISSIIAGSILNLTFEYDPNGDITSITNPDPPGGEVFDPPGTYTYQTGTNKLTHIEGTPPIDFGYDANANITSETGWTYIYQSGCRVYLQWSRPENKESDTNGDKNLSL